MERQAETDDLSSLEAELHTWRKTPFDRLLTRRPPFQLTALTEVAAQARGVGREQIRLQDIRATLVAVVAAVEQARPAAPARAPAGAICSPGIIREVFGLTNASENASTQAREELAGRTVTPELSWHTIRKHRKAYVDQLAFWIRSPQSTPERPTITGSTPLRSIPRSTDLAWLHTTYRNLMADNGGLFLLWGLDGMGKSTLARRFANQVGTPEVTGFIRLGRRGLYERDIRQVLSREGVDDSPLSDEQCIARFRAVAARFNAIRLLVLDDVRTEENIHMLLPHGSNIPVLITASTRPTFGNECDSTPPPARLITGVPDEDVRTWLRDQLKDVTALTEETLDGLTSVLGGHAEAIHLVVRYLKSDNAMSPEDLLEDISRRTQHALHDLAELGEVPRSLSVIVEGLYEAVRDDPMASAILASIVWTHSGGERPRDLVVEIAGHLAGRPSPIELQAAVHRLERLGLVTQTETSLAVPRLTARILRDLLIGDQERVLLAYERAIAEPPVVGSRSTLLEILRHEYQFLAPLRPGLAQALSNAHTPLPVLLPLDDTMWALFMTDGADNRRVTLYRATKRSLLYLDHESFRWQPLAGGCEDEILELLSQVYPTISTCWAQVTGYRA
ncbi:ATP-binding protein [Kibdelosporangium aridum]|uniref:NB-ARC domain-containing protein n=1 Tax=Kibdelosporangium aridum TaxID=2030 RepID=A0A1Y5XRZ0_KIBAR|nr:ATP-binding protein [Kibdelosporangium aridum]SMD14526.1 hypothetical protein SAMN05661093_05061 [Kibdelosporangium aridum]